MRRVALLLCALPFLWFVPRPAAAAVGLGSGGDDGAKQAPASLDIEELAKQALSTWQSALTLPSDPPRWPTIVVNGKDIPGTVPQTVNLYLAGDATLLATKISIALERELEKAKKAGTDVSHVIMSDAEFKKRVLEFKERLEQQAPDMTWDQFLVRQQQTEESFLSTYRTQLMFENYFTPKDSTKWPAVTLESALALRPNLNEKEKAEFLEQIKTALRDPAQASVILVFMLKQQIIKRVVESVEVKDLLDGLPTAGAMSFDGKTFNVDELYKRGMGLGSYLEFLRAIQFAAIREAVRQAIVAREDEDWAKAKEDAKKRRAAGEDVKDPARPMYWLVEGSPDFKAAFEAEVAKYPATPPFDHKGLVRFRRFPTMSIYRLFFQMRESYKRLSQAERTLEALKAHVEKDNLFFSYGEADVEAIWYSIGGDPGRAVVGSYEDAFGAAKERAMKGLADIKEGARRADDARKKAKAEGKTDAEGEKAAIEAARGSTFREILERDSDYRDPVPKPGSPPPMMPSKRGRFGPQYRNPLSEIMHESELLNLLSGYSLAEELFFHSPIGMVLGPVRGADGYFLARTLARNVGTKVMDLKDEKQREFVDEDLIDHDFPKFVNAVMAKAKIEMKN
jgi:hypothetical protein